MRHRLKKKKLNRDYDHRRAVMKNLIRALFTEGRVETTKAKGEVLLRMGERLVSRAKKGDLAARRFLFRFFQDQKLVNQIVDEIIPSLGKRRSGFLRLRKVKKRRGDDALIVRVEWVEKIKKEEKSKKGEKEK